MSAVFEGHVLHILKSTFAPVLNHVISTVVMKQTATEHSI